jgi:hypothetical protein
MTLKAIEMQIAIPRTQEVGKYQEQLHGRTPHEQFLLASEQQKKDQRKRKTSESMEKARLLPQDPSSAKQARSKNTKRNLKQDEDRKENIHPYKGKIVDISL